MLDSLRVYATSWPARILMGLLFLSFAAWGVNDAFNGFGTNNVAVVGDTPVTVVAFQRDYQQASRNLTQQVGQALTPEQLQQFGVPTQVLGRLVSQATLDNAGQNMGLGISNEELGKRIAADSQFAGVGGKFDRNVFADIVRNYGFTEDAYIMSQRHDLVRSQLAQAFGGGIASPVSYVRAVHDYTNEERNLSYLVLTAPEESAISEPSDTDLNTYFEAHKAEWKAPEVRAVSYFLLSPSDVAAVDEVSDEDAQKSYDAQKARFTKAEQRKVQQIVFKDRAEADAAAALLTSGTTFDALVTQRNLKPADVDLGLLTKDKIIDPKIADAAFAAQLNTPTAVVDGQFGPAILYVTEIDPATVTSFDAAKADLKKEIATQRAATEVTGTRDSIEDDRAGGTTLAEVAAKYNLKLITIPALDNSGDDATGTPVANLPSGLVGAVFQSDVGLENDPIQPDGSSFLWYDVTGVTAPHDRTLSEVREKIVKAWKDAERTKRLDEQAAAAKQRLDAKESIDAVAASLTVPVKKAEKITRASAATDDLPKPAIAAAFTVPQGGVAEADGAKPMTRVLMLVDSVSIPPFNENALDLTDTKQTLDSQFVSAILSMYIAQVQSQTKISFNQVAIQAVVGGTAGATE
jgi:peptidyl-prolyl cis-trans isomerase D